MNLLREKIQESFTSVFPIALIVTILCVTIVPVETSIYLVFLFGVVALVFGMGLFSLGSDVAMLPMGEEIGMKITQSKKIWLITLASFVLGMLVTLAEPDLAVLANQVPGIRSWTFIIIVSAGVGVFLVFAMLRILFKIPMKYLLLGFYIVILITSFFTPLDFLAIAYDSGGVTTGPITVPFIMSLGIGVASIRSDKNSQDDSFGLVALCSIGPVLAVLIMGIVLNVSGAEVEPNMIAPVDSTRDALAYFLHAIPDSLIDVGVALSPVIVFFLLFQTVTRSFSFKQTLKILVGIFYTFLGIVIFLTGVNTGFLPMGQMLGEQIAALAKGWLLIPIGMIIGYFMVSAEPAVHVLNKQVENVSLGAIPQKAMKLALCIGVSFAVGLAMLRLKLEFSILWVVVPGYIIAVLLSFFVPGIYTGIAFDSGGIAAGTMVGSFVLPFALGACQVLGMNPLTDAFGVIGFVALTPLITVQCLGIMAVRKHKKSIHVLEEMETIIDYEEEDE